MSSFVRTLRQVGLQLVLWACSSLAVASDTTFISDILAVKDALIQHQEELSEHLTPEKLKELVSKGQIEVDVPEKGHGNLTLIDGKIVPRVVHESSGIAFLFVDKKEIDEDSVHLRRYVSKQHFIAGANRSGRDVVLVWFESGSPSEAQQLELFPDGQLELFNEGNEATRLQLEEFPRHKKGSLSWFKDYFTAIYQRPKFSDVVFGASCGMMQAVMACGVSLAKMGIVGGAFQPEPALLSALFGTVIGSYVSTYKEWSTMGSQTMQTIKSSSVSLLFSYSLVAMTQNGFHSLNFFDPHGLMNHFNIALNAYANNLAKVGWAQLPMIRDELRINSGTTSYRDLLKWVGEKSGHEEIGNVRTNYLLIDEILDMQFKRSAVENQANYLIPFTLKLGDLIQMSIPLPGGLSLPLGKAALWASIPLSRYLALKYVQTLNAKEILDAQHIEGLSAEQREQMEMVLDDKIRKLQEKYAEIWSKTKSAVLQSPLQLARFTTQKIMQGVKAVSRECKDLLSSK